MAKDETTGAIEDPKGWRAVGDEQLQSCKVFDVHRATMESPHTQAHHPFYRIESADWVNVVALTESEELVLVRQFRQGSRVVTREIPGGMIDPGEAPDVAGARELLEETGYAADRQVSLGSLNPNPALFTNRVHFELALDCRRVAEIENGPTEETVVELLPLADLDETLEAGGIDHALVHAALYAFQRYQAKQAR